MHKLKIISLVVLIALSILIGFSAKLLGLLPEQLVEWYHFIGSFHPLLLHLPIGCTLLLLTWEIIGFVYKPYQSKSLEIPLIFNALTSLMAMFLGLVLYQTGDWQGDLIESHLIGGCVFTIMAIWLPYIYICISNKLIYRISLFISVITLTLAAHKGGEITHGDPLDKAPWKKQAKETTNPNIYSDIVVPILESKCYSCHAAEKQKNGLRLDSIAMMLKGDDLGAVIVPYKTDESRLTLTIEHLPIDDDYHMPPENKPQVTPSELELLKWWINLGAPEEQYLNDTEIPSELQIILESYMGSEALEKEPQVKNLTQLRQEKEELQKRKQVLDEKINIIFEKYPKSVEYIDINNLNLYFTAASFKSKFTDNSLNELVPIANYIKELDLNGSKVSEGLSNFIPKAKNVEIVQLANTPINNENLKPLAEINSLRILNIHSTQITDESIELLTQLSNLEKLYLWNTKISAQGIKKIQEKLPKCLIIGGSKEA